MGRIERMAFAYRLTGNAKIGEAVRKWMLEVASWDPRGATSAAINDEISLPILYLQSRAYTWAYDALSEDDRKVIQENMRIRGTEAFRILKKLPYESRPYHSHPGRSLGFLGEAAIAFLGDFPEAEEWFDYVMKVFFAIYPAWGGDLGGWAEGQAYWGTYIDRVLWWLDALKVATDLDLYQKEFFKNTGYFKLYTQPPYSKIGPFGDHSDEPPNSNARVIMSHLAGVYKNPYFKWYSKELGGGQTGVMGYIRAFLASPLGVDYAAPIDLPQARYFSDIGWVAMHRNLADEEENIQFMLKSSPYGSASHSYADQNGFTIEAYGEPLVLPSGYRPWYGSNHHMNWTKQSKAQNTILIGGQGQPIQSIGAKGKIAHFVHGDSFDYTLGDASQAYPNAERFLRHVVYVRPDMFVMFDDLEAKAPVTYDWLLHTYYEMQVDQAAKTVVVPGKKAQLAVRFFGSEAFTWSQTNEFEVPLDQPMNKPEQWHLKATTVEPSKSQVFLTTLHPQKANTESDLNVVAAAAKSGSGVVIKENGKSSTVMFRQQSNTQGIQTGRLQSDGLAVAIQENLDGSLAGALLVQGSKLTLEGREIITASSPVDVEMSINATGLKGSVTAQGASTVTISLPFEPEKVLVDGAELQASMRTVSGTTYVELPFVAPGAYPIEAR